MSWDDDDDNIDSDKNLFGDEEEVWERRVGIIRRARVLRDDVENDDWDPPEEPVILRMPWFVPEGEEWSIEMCLVKIGELDRIAPEILWSDQPGRPWVSQGRWGYRCRSRPIT